MTQQAHWRFWNEAENFKKRDRGVDPVDAINIVQRALVLIGNAHFVFMTDRRKGLLIRILPECVDLVDDSMAKKALLKSKNYLYGKKFRKILTNDGKDYKELYEMFPQRNRVPEKNVYFGQKSHYSSENKQQQQQFFRYGPPSNNFRFWGQTSKGRYQRKSWPREPDKNDQELIQVRTACLFPKNPEQSSVPIAGRIKKFYPN